jgi:branched-subunit amino acid transport protein
MSPATPDLPAALPLSAWEFALVVLGMAALSAFTRAFFFLSRKEWPMPAWLRTGLKFGPAAALVAVVAPAVVMGPAGVVATWQDARLWAAAAAALYFSWRRDLLGTIVWGMVVMLALRLGLGW